MAVVAMCVVGCGSGGRHSTGRDASGASSVSDGKGAQGVNVISVIGKHVKPAAGGAATARGAVARVSGQTISKSAFEGRLAVAAGELSTYRPVLKLVPPKYEACVAQLTRVPAASSSTQKPTVAQLRSECEAVYTKLEAQVMKELISSEWVLATAAADGLTVSDEEVRERMARGWPSIKKFKEYVRLGGNNVPNMLYEVKVQLLEAKLVERAEVNVAKTSDAALEKYYTENRQKFRVPEKRDLELVRTESTTDAARGKRELETGVKFADVVKKSGPQPLYLTVYRGLLKAIPSGLLHEPALNNAIFAARAHTISGPVRVNKFPGYHARFHRNPEDINNVDGYYVFEVQAIHPAFMERFGKVRSRLAHEVPMLLKEKALGAFIVKWRMELHAATSCLPGYVVRKCQQYVAVRGEEPEDPYTVN
jgi:hypothetical protein